MENWRNPTYMNRFTNQYNLPLPLYQAVCNDPYNPKSDVTVTQLLKPVQAWVLEKRHKEEISEDASDRLWATYGQLMSLLLERGVKGSEELSKRYVTEQRCTAIVEGWTVSGAFDLFDNHEEELSDWKFVGAYKAKLALKGDHMEWTRQLNMLRYLYNSEQKKLAKSLKIYCIVRDFTERVEKEGIKPVEIITIPVHPLDQTEIWMRGRVLEFRNALELSDGELPHCSEEDTWQERRCRRYCAASGHCVQWRGVEWLPK